MKNKKKKKEEEEIPEEELSTPQKKRKFFFFFFLAIFLALFFLARKPAWLVDSKEIKWGITFSQSFAELSDLDWQKTYLAILDELNPAFVRIPVYWSLVEKNPGVYDFSDYDWMLKEARARKKEVILVVGRKTPRWPECHVPAWAKEEDESVQQSKVLDLIERTVSRYQNYSNLRYWQVENEPFLNFGECPPLDVKFLDQEIALVKKLDPNKKVLITDSGEMSIWLSAAKRGDIFGTTMYRVVWNEYWGHFKYPLPPRFFWFKANLVRLLHPKKPIMVIELQGESWSPKQPYETPLEDQEKSMSFTQFKENIDYAEQVGFSEVCLWGAEWWYWLKEKHDRPEFWEEAQRVIKGLD